MDSGRDLSKHPCVVILGVMATLTTIAVSCIAIFTFVTDRDSLLDLVRDQPEPTPPIQTTIEIPTPVPADFRLEPSLPSNNTCPTVRGMIWLQFPNVWYGPFTGGDALMFSSLGGFYVWDADMLNIYGTLGAVIPYPDPYLQMPRNTWIPLNQSIFSVCVDSTGNVFGVTQ